MNYDPVKQYKASLVKLRADLKDNKKPIRVKKKTISNLFRYENRKPGEGIEIDLSKFDKPIYLDKKHKTLDLQALTTYETIVKYTLPHGLIPYVTPELKHITVGGANVGIGVETNSYRYGFVHDSLLEADMLLSNGRVITVSKTKNADLFKAIGNSYGTLGYILRAKIKLRPVKPYMHLETQKVKDIKTLLARIASAVKNPEIDSIEALAYSKNKIFLTTTVQSDKPKNLKSIYGPTILYKEISRPNNFSLKTEDFLFRYDPEWFWNIPDNFLLKTLRKTVPPAIRNSGFYKKYGIKLYDTFLDKEQSKKLESLVQDWEVPWENGEKLFNFFFDTVELNGNPIIIAPIKTLHKATLYPMKRNYLYMNLGCYCNIKRKNRDKPFDVTKKLDNYCFKLRGIKMLYSSTFLTKQKFDKIYSGREYAKLKAKYDPAGLLPTLFEKAVKAG